MTTNKSADWAVILVKEGNNFNIARNISIVANDSENIHTKTSEEVLGIREPTTEELEIAISQLFMHKVKEGKGICHKTLQTLVNMTIMDAVNKVVTITKKRK